MKGEISNGITSDHPVHHDPETGLELVTLGDATAEDLARLYVEHGDKCAEHLNGRFAFALYDPRSDSWLIGRDRAGSIPLYYATSIRNTLLFADAITPLLSDLPEVRLNPNALLDYLTFLWATSEETFFEGVRLIPSGNVVSPQGTHPYFHLQPQAEDRSEEEWCEEIRETLRVCVEDACVGEIGCHLSGGVDSSVVSAMAVHHAGKNTPTFGTSFPQYPDYDESPFGRKVADHIGCQFFTADLTYQDIPEQLHQLMTALEEPKCHPSVFSRFALEAPTVQNGCTRVLTGRGADELFSGYDAHRDIFHADHRARRTVMDEDQVRDLLRPEFLNNIKYSPADSYDSLYENGECSTQLDSILVLDFNTLMANWMVIDYKFSESNGISCVAPFLDKRMIDLTTRIPISLKAKNGAPKYLLKHAVAPLLPHEVIHRPKVGFRTPMGEMLREGLESYVRDTLTPNSSAYWDVMNPAGVSRLIEIHFSGERNVGWQIWALLCIREWYAHFIDTPREVS